MSAFMVRTRRSRLFLAILSVVCVSAFAIFHYHPTLQQELPKWQIKNVKFQLPKSLQRQEKHQQPIQPNMRHRLPCSNLTGADDVVYVIKTGATEVYEKLPVHFNTTLKCPPNSLIFSDFAETLDGHEIHDALANITPAIQQENPDFELWRRLHENGRAALDESELSTHDTVDPNGGGGNPGNSGWRLDKFKNLPMVQKTFEKYPDKKWYLFTDADTYIVWSNLLTWTAMMDPTQKLYLGSQAVIGDQVFGHGGSGYILSNAAMAELAALYGSDQEHFDQKAADHWAGDAVLAEALEHELNITLTWSFPVIQGGDPDVQDFSEYGYDRQLWCYPVVSYHHMKPSTIGSLWYLEQDWTTMNHSEPLKHKDVFRTWVLPQINHTVEGWDNLADEEIEETVQDEWDCRAVCEDKADCVQYSYRNARCRISGVPRLGFEMNDGSRAGWMMGRMHRLMKRLDECSDGDWILP